MIVPESAFFADEFDDCSPESEIMAYEKPAYSLNQVDKTVGRIFRPDPSIDEIRQAFAALNNWRAAHRYPMHGLHMTLRNRTLRVDPKALTAQRLKRLESVIRKLTIRDTMKLSQMQDVGGCRAVVANMTRLNILRFIYETHPLRHSLSKARDYIYDPKDDGYRGVHLMYRFVGRATSVPWDKLRVEIQLRTKLQHAWATAVETVDAFTGQDLKFGGGTPEWKRFFALMGSVHAIYEKSPTVPGTPDTHAALANEVRNLERELEVTTSLRSYAHLIPTAVTFKRCEPICACRSM